MTVLSPTETDNQLHDVDPQVRCYRSHFEDSMQMLAPQAAVAHYLDDHQSWFERCASPMQVEAIDRQSYSLTLGRFGNFGFELEPTIALRLLPQKEGIYRIATVRTVPQSMALPLHYDVDFRAGMHLIPEQENTSVQWDLDLKVWIRLPKVITMLPDQLVQSSGDHLLKQIVRQISRRLTWKVQKEFHVAHRLICPPRKRAAF